jgi:hypothetical protein
MPNTMHFYYFLSKMFFVHVTFLNFLFIYGFLLTFVCKLPISSSFGNISSFTRTSFIYTSHTYFFSEDYSIITLICVSKNYCPNEQGKKLNNFMLLSKTKNWRLKINIYKQLQNAIYLLRFYKNKICIFLNFSTKFRD